MSTQMTRPYRKRRRAELEEETRRRITQATMELHELVGPAQTTVSAIAERAGVQRATVYRHFPDDMALITACSAHWMTLNPALDERLRLRDAYFAAALETLLRGRPERGGRRRRARGAIAHALEFETWRSLVRHQGLAQSEAV